MKHIALVTSLLVVSPVALGQTYTNANLNGKYSFQFGSAQTYTWSKTFSCPSNSLVDYTVNGFQTGMSVTFGVATFDGKGSLSVTSTQIGRENQTASANTTSVTWNSSCHVVSVNTGSIIYQAPVTNTQTGTYSVQSNGTGSLNIVGSTQGTIFQLAGTNSTGLSTTILVTNPVVNGNDWDRYRSTPIK